MNIELANSLRPVSEPRLLHDIYTVDQHRRLVEVVRREGPWKLILAQHFSSAEEVVATLSGSMPEGVTPTFDMFLTTHFRGYLAEHGTCFYPELEDCFYNSKFLDLARSYWNAKYAQPMMMLFNIQGPAHCHDPGHLDGVNFRGLTHANSPIWLANTMGKSGLFKSYLKKMAQVIAWFYPGELGGGFTYWPEGPLAQPKRLPSPMWNNGVLVQAEMMYHRPEANGPLDMRHPQGLAFNSMFGADPEVSDGWRITTDGKVIQRIPAKETRFLVHWSADVYEDFAELKKTMDHSDDLDHEKVFDIFIQDLRARGISFPMPSEPLNDPDFVHLLAQTYDVGTPHIYPPEAPGPHQLQAA
jgi:hypothetical protein